MNSFEYINRLDYFATITYDYLMSTFSQSAPQKQGNWLRYLICAIIALAVAQTPVQSCHCNSQTCGRPKQMHHEAKGSWCISPKTKCFTNVVYGMLALCAHQNELQSNKTFYSPTIKKKKDDLQRDLLISFFCTLMVSFSRLFSLHHRHHEDAGRHLQEISR